MRRGRYEEALAVTQMRGEGPWEQGVAGDRCDRL